MTNANDLALPTGYTDLLGELKSRVRFARTKALRTVNTQLIELYWSIGHDISSQQESQGWGSGVIKRLADDLRAEFPEMKGFSARNLQYMTTFARSWVADPIAQQPVAQLPWGHITVLLDKVGDSEKRDWYASAAVEYGWSRNVLMNMIMNKTLERDRGSALELRAKACCARFRACPAGRQGPLQLRISRPHRRSRRTRP
jgi:predicted nuclease of restriction endonuclease-like (RecB) superfamily